MMRSTKERRPLRLWLAAGGPLVLAVLLAAVTACDQIILPEEPEEPVYDNPVDPDSPDFVAPQTTITDGPAEGSTISTNSATFTWQGNLSGMLFQARLNGSDWSPWSTAVGVTLEYLDEIAYTFEVRSAYNPGVGNTPTLIDDSPASRSFTVDAVTGPALRLSPTLTLLEQDDTFDIDLIAEDVSDLMMVATIIRFNPNRHQVISAPTEGSFLTSTGGSIAKYIVYDNSAGTIEVNMATATGSPPGVSGTGTVLTIQFQQINSENGAIWFATGSSVMRDSNNNAITLTGTHGAVTIIR